MDHINCRGNRWLEVNTLTSKKQTTKFTSANFQNKLSPSYNILRIRRLEGKQCRSWWGGSLWATSSRSTLFANSAIFSLVVKELSTGKWLSILDRSTFLFDGATVFLINYLDNCCSRDAYLCVAMAISSFLSPIKVWVSTQLFIDLFIFHQ